MGRLEIPARVKVRGRWWAVKRGQDLDGTVKEVAGHAKAPRMIAGLTVPDVRVIHLARDLQAPYERATFLHELVHACSRRKIPAAYEEKLLEDVDEPLLAALESMSWG